MAFVFRLARRGAIFALLAAMTLISRLFAALFFLTFVLVVPVWAQDEASDEAIAEAEATADVSEESGDEASEVEETGSEAEDIASDLTTIETSDGILLKGEVSGDESASTWLVIFPNLNETIEDYSVLVEPLSGVGVLTVYPRGVGESTATADGDTIDHRDFDPRGTQQGFLAMIGDAGDVAKWVREEKGATKIVFLGSRITANMLAEAAGADALGSGAGLILLTPGEVLRGFRLTEENFTGADLGSLVLFGEDDENKGRVADQLRHGANLTQVEVDGSARGVAILEDEAAITAITEFLAGL